MRILIHSNAMHVNTGYGVQTSLLAPQFQRLGHEVAVSAFYGLEGSGMVIPGYQSKPIPVYPKLYAPYGEDIMASHAQHFGADIVIPLIDAWVTRPDTLRPPGRPEIAKHVPYYPVDMDPLSPAVRAQIDQAFCRVAMSRYGEQVTRDSKLDCEYAPHMIDTGTYKPADGSELRKQVGIPDDAYLVGIVAANKGQPARKSWPQMIEAFAKFQKTHPTAWLHVHTTRGEQGEMQGLNLPEMVNMFGANPRQVVWADQYQLLLGYPANYMSVLYSAFDLLMNCAMGEGFGVPVLEAQACGTPVLVGDWTAMSELCFEGYAIPKTRENCVPFWTPLAAYQYLPHPDAILEGLHYCHDKYGRKTGPVAGAVEHAQEYEQNHVVDTYWKPILDQISERLAKPAHNREQRRAAKRLKITPSEVAA